MRRIELFSLPMLLILEESLSFCKIEACRWVFRVHWQMRFGTLGSLVILWLLNTLWRNWQFLRHRVWNRLWILRRIESKIERTFDFLIKSVHFLEENQHFSVKLIDLLLKKTNFFLKKLDRIIEFFDFFFIEGLSNLALISGQHCELFYKLVGEVNLLVKYLYAIP